MLYSPTIGLEIHIELNTKTKMFCGCVNDPNEKEPNKNVCPICLAHPGTLPTINREAVESVVKLGLALNGEIAKKSHFDRKSYFYPDLPKGYQISQYEHPLVQGGELNNIRIRRIHLEEDTGKLVHSNHDNSSNSHRHSHRSSSVDFNRAGVPLVELVTEPDITSGKQTMEFAKELQLILRYLHIANADMEKGEMRIEANVSVSKTEKLGTKVELKNINSFRFIGDAIDVEIKRQTEILESGGEITQETRGWDEKNQTTRSQRIKEEAHDYRYLPEPDLPELNLEKPDLVDIEKFKKEMPELPEGKRNRFGKEYGLNSKQSAILVDSPEAAEFFEESVSELKEEITDDPQLPTPNPRSLIYNYLTSDLFSLIKDQKIDWSELKITPENFADLISLLIKGELTSRMAKDIILEMQKTGEDPKSIMERQEIKQVTDENLIVSAIEETIKENEKAVSDYKNGNPKALQFIVGKTMAKLKGQGNPEKIKELAEKILSN